MIIMPFFSLPSTLCRTNAQRRKRPESVAWRSLAQKRGETAADKGVAFARQGGGDALKE